MKKMTVRTATSLAAAIAATCAQAQAPMPAGVQLYGVLDAGVEIIDKVGVGGRRVVRMPALSGGQLPSRWGLRGSEDLGSGTSAVFTLEAGFAPDSGAPLQGGRAFGRQAFVGLAGPWGTLSFGRQWTMGFHAMLDADVIGPSVFGLATLDPYLPNARADNAVAWRGRFSGITLGATWSPGRDGLAPVGCGGENAARECRAWSVLARYDAPAWGVAMAHERLHGGATGAFFGQPAGTVANASNSDRRTHLNGYLRLGGAKVGGGLIRRRLQAVPTPLATELWYAGLSMPVAGAVSLDAQLIALRDGRPGMDARTALLRGNYAFSRRTAAYAMVAHASNGANASYAVSAGEAASVAPAAGRGQSGLMVGIRHSF